jgi:hypothetical protein
MEDGVDDVDEVDASKLDSDCDIQVDAKPGQVVMIIANPAGRKIVEFLWPTVKWSTDEKFARVHSDEWLFAHVRVTRLPPHITAPLNKAVPDSLGMLVACALQRRAAPAGWSICGHREDLHVARYDVTGPSDPPTVEYVSPGVYGPPLASFGGAAH